MGKLFLLVLLFGVSLASFARPWIGIVFAYLFAILQPQTIWYWNFDGLRPVYWILIPTFIGFLAALGRKEFDPQILKNKRVYFMAILWFFYALSYFIGPYTDARGPFRFTEPDWAFSTLNKILLVWFIAAVCIDDLKKLKALCGVILVSGIYLTYWANSEYLSGHVMGRLAGPVDVWGAGVYADENDFAMVFVVASAFLYFAGFAVKNVIVRYGLWLVVPLSWHAIFLTASRGGLVGIAVTLVIVTIRSKNRALGLLIIPLFAAAYFWQAGDLMRSRADTIGDYQTETSSATRIQAWTAATGMIAAHPITGVGLASFGPAFPDFSEDKPRQAHNTFFQIAAESGLTAGIMYLGLTLASIIGLWRNGNRLRAQGGELYYINEATLVAFTGFGVCSMFLSLSLSEIFYCLCLISNAVLYVSARAQVPANAAPTPGNSRLSSRLKRRPSTLGLATGPASTPSALPTVTDQEKTIHE